MTVRDRRVGFFGFLAAIALVVGVLPQAAAPAGAAEDWPPPECERPEDFAGPETDVVACVAVDSAAVGGLVPVAYHLPSACLTDGPCPVVYQLHGFGGTYRSQLGTRSAPSGWVHALTSKPPEDPEDADEPWAYGDPTTWVPASPIDFISIAPHGRTVPGGFGPAEGLDSYWTDWNPRYALGGDDERYDTPPPRFATFLADELPAFVEDAFPAGSGREWRAITGVSLGGYGSFLNALQRPDHWAGAGSVSGALNFLFAPAPQPVEGAPDASVLFPAPVGPLAPPPVLGGSTVPGPAEGFLTSLVALGDPATEQPRLRGHMPVDLAANARAFAGEEQSLYLDYFVNDAVARQADDVNPQDPGRYLTDQAFEAIVLPMNADMEVAFEQQEVRRDFSLNPGLHRNSYWNPWLRRHLERLHAHVRQRGGGGEPPAAAERFDHRSVSGSFSVWGWGFDVERGQLEFLDLFDVSCEGLTLRGTGEVTVAVPPACGTGIDGSRVFTVDLGHGAPTPGPHGANPGARTERVDLEPLPAPRPGDPHRPPHAGPPDHAPGPPS